jgi:AraC-like DNA-binding protein
MDEGLRLEFSLALGGLERIEGVVASPHFARHTHDTYGFGIVEEGINRSFVEGAWQDAGPGQLCAITAGEPHASEPADGAGFTYRCLYPTSRQLKEAACGLAGRPRPGTIVLPPVFEDPVLAVQVRRFFAAASAGAGLLEQEELLAACLARLIARHALARAAREIGRIDRAVHQARELLAARIDAPPSLTELAAAVGMNPYRLARAFRRAEGLPPHAFVVQLRVDRARRLLRDGWAASDVAAVLGFADQAHLTRQFRRRVGVTPAAYARTARRSGAH